MKKNEVVKINTDSGQVELSVDIIRTQIAKGQNITDTEIMNFMMLCKYRGLNPFLGQAHLVKFGDDCQMITGKDVFTQRLNQNQLCKGWETGVIVLDKSKEITKRVGTLVLETDTLIGAYCTIEREGWKKPFEWTINLKDYLRTYRNKKTGKTEAMGNWAKMPAVMLVKCAMVSAVRNVFPESFGGMYDADEIGVDMSNVVDVTPKQKTEKQDKVTYYHINKIKDAAKSNDEAANKSYDNNKLIDYALNKLFKKGEIESTNLNDLKITQVDSFVAIIKSLVEAKEKEFAEKNGIKNSENKTVNDVKNKEKEPEFEEMPVIENFAKPANSKKENKDNEK